MPTEHSPIRPEARYTAHMLLDCKTLLDAYAQGVFPMADDDGQIEWYHSDPRGILPLDAFHLPGTLRQILRQGVFEIRINSNFRRVIQACRELRLHRTWISPDLIDAYMALHHAGHAHSVEAWRDGDLAGGLYGVSLGGAFFGESMFHFRRDASKVALAALVQRLRDRGFELLDIQTRTQHLKRFGAIEIPEQQYLARLKSALARKCSFVDCPIAIAPCQSPPTLPQHPPAPGQSQA